MKITADQLDALRAKIAPLDTEEVRAAYREGRFPRADKVKDLDKRYRWDLLWAAKGYIDQDGITDAHIDTALRSIVPPLAPAVVPPEDTCPSGDDCPKNGTEHRHGWATYGPVTEPFQGARYANLDRRS